ncbi:hypothetical protein JDS97_26980 [Bacillus cereus group sp. N18]|uniref:hypothetical protein n=1 Tax=Bacillus cereus group sp. N18 TaxID=2794590 RepID=UPI000871FDBD|nr:hypothetical protein [Bacillus cereus group sp. N18]OFC94533.1 hypothetical protein BTGOE5_51920 [Bacillus thuringiensis]HDR7325878.1 hypothetical protein [Bacillus toyonensis]MBJ8049880.1 hypothetical protein [Bacillus cereus group sp. N18]OFD02094.1 hypothetical protein BTGOE7_53660 [Bacillus thuringiensis]HDR7443135.1 hypothetical protein [Bacillus toyonensis]
MNIIPEHISLTKNTDNLYILTNNITQTHIKVGELEIQFLSQIYTKEATKSDAFTDEQKQYLYENYKNLGFLSKEDSYNLINKKQKNDLSRIYLLRKDPSNFFEKNEWLYKGKHIPWVLFLIGLTILVSCFIFAFNIRTWTSSVSLHNINISTFIIMYILIIFTLFIHECAHALSCYYFGGKVKEVGAMLMYMSMAFYCNVSSIYLFQKKSHRLIVLLAGIFSQLFLSAIAVIISYFAFLNGFKIDIILYYIAFNSISILFNLSPVIKLDGYWILVQLTNITNLREKSFKYILSYTRNKYRVYRNNLLKKEKRIFLTYGIIGIIGTYLMWVYSVHYLNKISHTYLGHWGIYIVVGWIILLIFHIIRKVKKYIGLLKNDIIHK